jgi:hypothetical protein
MKKTLLALLIPAIVGCASTGLRDGTYTEKVNRPSGSSYMEQCATSCISNDVPKELRIETALESTLKRFQDEFDCKLWYDERKMPCWEDSKDVYGMSPYQTKNNENKTCVTQCVSFHIRD